MFFDQASKAYETLRGEFSLVSDDGGFVLKGIMTNKGHARIEVAFEGGEHKMPDDSNCRLEAISPVIRTI